MVTTIALNTLTSCSRHENTDVIAETLEKATPRGSTEQEVDPLDTDPENPMTHNRYAYGNNNPYKYTDPNGESAKLVVTGFKIAYKSFKAKGNVRQAGLGEIAGIADDISTLADGDWIGMISERYPI